MTPEAVSLATAVLCSAWTFAGSDLIFRRVKQEGAPPGYRWEGTPLGVRLLWIVGWLACLFGPLLLMDNVNNALQPSQMVKDIGLGVWILGLSSSALLVVQHRYGWHVAVIQMIGIAGCVLGAYASAPLWSPLLSGWIHLPVFSVSVVLGYWLSICLAVRLGVRAGLLSEQQATDVFNYARTRR